MFSWQMTADYDIWQVAFDFVDVVDEARRYELNVHDCGGYWQCTIGE